MKKMIFTAIIMLVAVMANAKDIKTVVLTTNPIMHCANCEAKIKENLKFCKGIKSIETNVANQSVTIQYDAEKTSPEAFILSLKKANYVATEKKACEGNKNSCGDHKGCGEKKECSGKCEGEKKSCGEHKGCGEKKECSGKCEGEKKSCGEHKGCGEKKECSGKCEGEKSSCGDCKHHDKAVDATTGATKKN